MGERSLRYVCSISTHHSILTYTQCFKRIHPVHVCVTFLDRKQIVIIFG